MSSVTSDHSHASALSKEIMDNVSRKSDTKLFKMEAKVDETTISKAWNAFGLYLARNLRAGRAINVLHLGVFTFGAPDVKLTGVTNPEDRDLRYRTPVFLVSKEFIKGLNIQTGIVSSGVLRPFSMVGVISGLPEVKINHADIAYTAQLPKDLAKVSIDRVIRELADKAKAKSYCELDIPHVGKLLIRNQIAAVEFHESLIIECLDSTNKTLQALKQRREKSMLTAQNLKDFLSNQGFVNAKDQSAIKVDLEAQSWLRHNLNIDIEALKNITRPQTATSVVSSLKSTNSIPWSRKSFSRADSVRSRPNSERNSIRSFNSGASRLTFLSEEQNTRDAPLKALKKRLRHWVKKQVKSPEEAYCDIVRKVYGAKATITSKITVSEFRKGIENIEDLHLNAQELDLLCKTLKHEGQTLVSFEKWAKLFMDEKMYSNYIKEIAVKYNLSIEDILRRMNINDKSTAQDLNTLKSNIKLLDPSLDDEKAFRISKELIQDKQRIEADQLIGNISDLLKQSTNNNSTYNNQLIHIKKQVKDLNSLRKHFEKYDEKNQGLIDSLAFREALLKLNLGFTQESVKQFIKSVDRDSDMMVDYIKFIDTIDKIRTEDYLQTFSQSSSHIELENFNTINEKLKEYFISNKLQPSELIRRISIAQDTEQDQDNTRVSIEQFSNFLKHLCGSVFINKKSFLAFSKKLDVDKDGFISETDIETFLNRNNYIKDGYKEALKSHSQATDSVKYNLFPVAPLSEEKIEVILRDLRHALNTKRISFYDFNKMIDVNRTGFITINDFCRGIDKVLKLSQPIKDGFYAYIDRERVGLVTYEDFVKVLKRSMVDKPTDVTEDSFDWQTEIINLIKNYVRENHLTSEDTFRILDADFDGYVNKNDLLRFVNEALNIPKEEITKTRIDRLFKLLDIHKRERIQLNDIKILLGGIEVKNFEGTSKYSEKQDYDWMLHARQQIGLELSKKYKSLADSFKIIAQDDKLMKYEKFRKWLEYSQVLTEFQMTERLIQKLFANIDPHKKGYLDENDWINTFSSYNIYDQLLSEVQQVILSQNSNMESAFEFFLTHEKQIHPLNRDVSFEGFSKAIQSLLPKRLEIDQIKYIWSRMCSSKNILSRERFNKLFENKEFNGTSYISHNKLPKKGTISRSLYQSLEPNRTGLYVGENISKEEKQKKIFAKLKQILNASKISYQEFFQNADSNSSGELSNLEFINALKRLNLGLHLKELEDLIMYCDSNLDGSINLREFASKFTPQFVENRIFDRARTRLKTFKDNIYSYMLSPKDAFLNFNKTRTGKLTYDQFNTLVVQLSILAREEIPSFHIIKDLFDFLDLRKDGVIDMTEWMQSFRIIENDPSGAGTHDQGIKKRPATVNVNTLNKLHFSKMDQSEKLTTASSISSWECSKDYEKILKSIGRNRKALTATFEDLSSKGVLVDFNKIKEVIGKLLETEGLKLNKDQWFYLYKFAEKDGVIDYKFMFDIFKERLYLLSAHPKVDV